MARVPKINHYMHNIVVFPCGSHTSPGASAGVPTILPTDIIQVLLLEVFSVVHLAVYSHLDKVLYGNGWEQMEASTVAVF